MKRRAKRQTGAAGTQPASEELYQVIFEQAADGIFIATPQGRYVEVNRRGGEMLGYSREEVLRLSWHNLILAEDLANDPLLLDDLRAGKTVVKEYRMRCKDGRLLPVEISGRMLSNGNLLDIVRDISERKRAEEHIRRLSRLYATLSQVNQTIVRVKDRETLFQAICHIAIEFGQFGMAWIGLVERDTSHVIPAAHAVVAKDNSPPDGFSGQDGLFSREPLAPALEEGQIVTYDDIWAIPDRQAWREAALKRGYHSAAVVPLTLKGEVVGVLSLYAAVAEHFTVEEQSLLKEIGLDISFALDAIEAEAERQLAVEALRESERQYHLLFDEMLSGFALHEIICNPAGKPVDYRFLAVNSAFEKLTGLRSHEIIGKTVREVIPGIEPYWIERYGLVALTGVPIQFEDYTADLDKYYEVRSFCPEHRKFAVIFQDVTERKRAEESVRESEERFRNIIENTAAGYFRVGLDERWVHVNKAWLRMHGYDSAEEVIGKHFSLTQVESDLEEAQQNVNRLLDGEAISAGEFTRRCKDGTIGYHTFSASPVIYGGKVVGLEGFIIDTTERKRAEEAQVKLGEQLRQAQKMESIGRLAGGLAHDFNNILVVIIGYSDLLLKRLQADAPFYEEIAQIKRAGERAAGLIRQLLAFSRQQILQPVVLNLNEVVTDLEKMLRRLIGEDIDLVIQLDPALRSVKADVGQIEQVILNLVVNARDAMPQGGQLTIETANVVFEETQTLFDLALQPGAYTLLTVSDTGEGIDREIRSYLFEPFFTTKEQGKGTGLGLAVTYGIVKQSGGDIWVESEPGQGATFKIYLPASEATSASVAVPQTQPVTHRGKETILLVEDEEMVRDLARLALQENGYTVLEARQGNEALSLSEQHQGPIDLLITDVVMPRMSGRELTKRLKVLRPRLKVIFTSGYTGDAVVRHGVLAAEVEFLSKPFSPDMLVSKVRQVLNK